MYQELLRDLTESYLKSLIAEASGSLSPDFDSSAPFGELGIDSFRALKIIKKLETDFGVLPKSLLFENFNINDLADYFVGKHEQALRGRFAERLGRATSAPVNGHPLKPIELPEVEKTPAAPRPNTAAGKTAPIRALEKEAYRRPELRELVQTLFSLHKREGSVSLGTRKIAPNLFIGGERRGYFNYGRSNDIILVYAYTGPMDYTPALLEEMLRYCETRGFQLNVLADQEIREIGGTAFSSTPFGALQRMVNLKEFKLEGGAMRRLRYQVSKFQSAGACRAEEYSCGSDKETDMEIVRIIDKWSEARTMVSAARCLIAHRLVYFIPIMLKADIGR